MQSAYILNRIICNRSYTFIGYLKDFYKQKTKNSEKNCKMRSKNFAFLWFIRQELVA